MRYTRVWQYAREQEMIAALFVDRRGIYNGRTDVIVHGLPTRDAMDYWGPFPCVAHPPCSFWGNRRNIAVGQEGGRFRKAFESVSTFGGIIEHPATSTALPEFGFAKPVWYSGWKKSDKVNTFNQKLGYWTCYVEQGNYGHKARKPTALIYCGRTEPFELNHWKSHGKRELGSLCLNQREATPAEFAEILLSLARMSND